jgi:hypothetical protein
VGKPAVEGDSPVCESEVPLVVIPSSARHVEPGVNLGGPPPKAKYYWTTDSVIVARAKGEKYRGERSEIVPETMHLQAVGDLWPFGAMVDGVPFA